MAGVTLRSVAKRFGETSVIEKVDLDIQDREFMVLVGPSGCGKSTLLRMIAGLEEITAGEILIGDRVVNDVPPKDRDIAMVFQSYALYPHMTIRENLEFGLKIRKAPRPEIDRLVAEAAQILGIDDLLDRKPKQLSGGQRQRVAVGRAIVRKPSVFLFDEPLSNLDAKLRVQMRAEIKRLQQRLGTTTVYVTHDQVEAMTMGRRIAVLNAGILQQVGSPLEVYETPVNVFVANFIGTPPMNFVPATTADQGATLRAVRFSIPTPASWRASVGAADGRRLILGIRPEKLTIVEGGEGGAGGASAGIVPVVVEVLELLGNEVIFHGRAGDDVLIAKTAPRRAPKIGATVSLRFDLEALHLFDAETERRLDSAPANP
ncbi:MAG TPA: sn-glycerol-3-phosphate ABC transporter ATP-binding protein UgpC [Candidatus Eisenbacteria bacterium]|nr:sn-glycerol-3-phosphate ABC transporter ATP-binding protein UgpC [Candidatus Eisenbacteria bacterium]